MFEIGCVDICLEVSMLLLSHLALTKEGHLKQLFHMFVYLKRNHNSEMIFDPRDPVIDESLFNRKSTRRSSDLRAQHPESSETDAVPEDRKSVV